MTLAAEPVRAAGLEDLPPPRPKFPLDEPVVLFVGGGAFDGACRYLSSARRWVQDAYRPSRLPDGTPELASHPVHGHLVPCQVWRHHTWPPHPAPLTPAATYRRRYRRTPTQEPQP